MSEKEIYDLLNKLSKPLNEIVEMIKVIRKETAKEIFKAIKEIEKNGDHIIENGFEWESEMTELAEKYGIKWGDD